MQKPFLVLSWGDFLTSKKLFSLEHEGIHCIPVFTDPVTAHKYMTRMNQALKEMGDGRTIHTQVCESYKMAKQMFETITAYYPDLMRVMINPSPPRDSESLDSTEIKLIEDVRDIDEFMDGLDDHDGSNTP
jgi:hypothetical protein